MIYQQGSQFKLEPPEEWEKVNLLFALKFQYILNTDQK